MLPRSRVPARLAALFVFISLAALPAAAQVFPAYINYQGKLGDPLGNPLTGTYSFQFALYNHGPTTAGATLLYTDTPFSGANAVTVSNGVYSVQIGSLTSGGIPPSVFLNSEVWLQVQVQLGTTLSSPDTLAPMERLASSPFAFVAAAAEGLGTGVAIGTFTAGGNLTVPGGLSGSSGTFTAGVTASSGTFTATGTGQYSLALSTSITFTQSTTGIGIKWADGSISTTAVTNAAGSQVYTITNSNCVGYGSLTTASTCNSLCWYNQGSSTYYCSNCSGGTVNTGTTSYPAAIADAYSCANTAAGHLVP
jgi:hypothetical protein